MPEFIEQALNKHRLMDAYQRRPDYQRNGYIGWITRAKRPGTRQKRLQQLLDELQACNVYMGMAWNARPRHDLSL